MDSRPSDAIALAVRTDSPIFAAQELLESTALSLSRNLKTPRRSSRSSATSLRRSARGLRELALFARHLFFGQSQNHPEDLLQPSRDMGPRLERDR